uniref:Polyadenylate-binding protein n=1 Tax=Tetraselmis sp. GSL018 TaxID=582737 RepID=A0A061RYV7_9CHLO|mmetsp:Transcript_37900/g.90015  ORF Transcript_37900/g.90015 Transcript_37900/m.90015 type:complete len:641 (+) Transcript_37900:323-2245(+)
MAATNVAQGQPTGTDTGDRSSTHPFNSLYVGDLLAEVNEAELFEIFSRVGPVVSIKLCRDIITRRSLGYAYVNYQQPEDAQRALEELNFTAVRGQQMRIMFSQRDPSARKSGVGNIFIKNLHKSITSGDLYATFGQFGQVLSCKIATDGAGNSKGYGFVQFEKQSAADEAIEKVNGMLMADQQVYVGHFIRRQDRDPVEVKFNNVYVKNLAQSCGEEVLKAAFGEYGELTSVAVMRDSAGQSKCFGFVNFKDPDAAKAAVEALNGHEHDGKAWFVSRAQTKSERDAELRKQREQAQAKHEKYAGCNLYIKNLDDSIGDDQLRALFEEYGSITSSRVMRDGYGYSKGSGFVAFSTPEEASRAISEMNGRMPPPCTKPLYVAIAQRKEERQARLRAQFQNQQYGPSGMVPGPGPVPGPVYNGPGMPGGMMFQGGAPQMMPPGGMGYPNAPGMPGMMPGVRPGMPYYTMPMVQHVPGRPSVHGGRGRGRGAGRDPMQVAGYGGYRQSMRPQGVMQPRPVPPRPQPQLQPQQQVQVSSPNLLTQQLHSATPESRRMLLGEALYPLIAAIQPAAAAKVTGMLLEMDQSEVLNLIESPHELRAKVEEAIMVLKEAGQEPQLFGGEAAQDPAAEAMQGGMERLAVSG